MDKKNKSKKAASRDWNKPPQGGQSLPAHAVSMARSVWESEGQEAAVDMLIQITLRFPRYEPAHRLLLQILIEERYHPKDVVWCLGRINKLGRLRPRDRVEYGLCEYDLGHHKKALPLLKEAAEIPEDRLEEWGYHPLMIQDFLLDCRTRLGLSPEGSIIPVSRGKKGSGASKGKARTRNDSRSGKAAARSPVEPRSPKKANQATAQGSQRVTPKTDAAPPPQEMPPIRISGLIESPTDLHKRFVSGNVASVSKYLLAQWAGRLSQADHFDSLICLNTLKNVKEYAYQIETVRKVMRSFRGRVLLADEVGLGKTIEAGMALKEYLLRGMVKKALILTPPALVSQWCEELSSKFDILPASTEAHELRQDPERFWEGHNLIVASLALARNKRHLPILSRLRFDLIIVDEAHHVKNDRTAGWKLVNELKSRFLLLLSATPVENNLMDLFSLVTLLKPGQLGTKKAFKQNFVLRGDPTQPRNRERLRALIGEIMIRNTRALADIRLPARHASTVLVEGEPAERELYAKLTDLVRKGFQQNLPRLSLGLLLQEAGSSPLAVQKTLAKMAGHPEVDAGMKAEMTRLAKLCGYVPNTSKTGRLLELLAASREKVLVFSRFTATLEDIGRRLSDAGIDFSIFQGNMSAVEKDRAVLDFQNGVPVMLCSEIGGEGRNLQFCSTMVNFDLPWNPMKIEQRIGRIHRIGQTRPVHVYNLCAANTAEHHILDVLDRRINMFELVIGEVDLVLGQTKTETEFEERILDIYGQSRNDQDIATAFEMLGHELLEARQRYDKIKRLDSEIFANDYEI
jgi:superfamily II DNA or RNA helicase